MNQAEWIKKLEAEGFTGLTVVTNKADIDFGEHTHDQHTVHVILVGELILTENGGVEKIKPGQQFEIPAGTTHSAKTGPDEVCTMIVGVKKD